MEDYKLNHSKLTTEDLIKIAYFDIRKIKKEARASAKLELQKRNIPEAEFKVLKDTISKNKRKERKLRLRNKNDSYNLLEFIYDVLLAVFD